MIAAIYARKSTDQTGVAGEQKSVARQVEHARLYAERKGCTVDESSRWRLFRCRGAGRSGAELWVVL
jgi:DNA invertase Pin-like site-specific DNA recombinase